MKMYEKSVHVIIQNTRKLSHGREVLEERYERFNSIFLDI